MKAIYLDNLNWQMRYISSLPREMLTDNIANRPASAFQCFLFFVPHAS